MGPLPALSVQLYSVREALAADLPATLARLAAIGLTRVEPYNLLSDPAGLKKALIGNDLTAPTAHARLEGNLDALFAAATDLGVETLIVPHSDPAAWASLAGISGIADGINAAVARAADSGLRLGYHNHQFELQHVIGGRPALEVFADLLDPAVVLEVDTYWAAVGGQDVPALLGRLGDRVRFLHLKDGPISMDVTAQLPLGAGAMPVAQIVAAAPAVEIAVLEFDAYVGDIFLGIAAGFAFAGSLAGPSNGSETADAPQSGAAR